MTTEQIKCVQENWNLVQPLGIKVGELFYKQLFAASPQLRSLFPESLEAQQAKLVHMLQYIVDHLDHLHEIAHEVKQLGRRHYHYHALPHHYELIGKALVETLQMASGNSWTQEISDAWRTAFNALRQMMIIAQEEERMLIEDKRERV